MRTAALCFCVSLALSAAASQSNDLAQRIQNAKSAGEFKQVVADAKADVDPTTFLGGELERAEGSGDWKVSRERLERALAAQTLLENHSNPPTLDHPARTAQDILKDPRYRDAGAAQDRNWMSKSMSRLQKTIQDQWDKINESSSQGGSGPKGFSMGGLDRVVWILLGTGLVALLAFFLVQFRLSRLKRHRNVKILDDDEPDLTADEWMTKAVDLENEGRIREAVRCLYLATLIRLDEAGFLRFVRSDTNWEHLRRFESASNRLSEIDLRSATKEFDRIWYGHRVHGIADSTWFRNFYATVLLKIKEKRV